MSAVAVVPHLAQAGAASAVYVATVLGVDAVVISGCISASGPLGLFASSLALPAVMYVSVILVIGYFGPNLTEREFEFAAYQTAQRVDFIAQCIPSDLFETVALKFGSASTNDSEFNESSNGTWQNLKNWSTALVERHFKAPPEPTWLFSRWFLALQPLLAWIVAVWLLSHFVEMLTSLAVVSGIAAAAFLSSFVWWLVASVWWLFGPLFYIVFFAFAIIMLVPVLIAVNVQSVFGKPAADVKNDGFFKKVATPTLIMLFLISIPVRLVDFVRFACSSGWDAWRVAKDSFMRIPFVAPFFDVTNTPVTSPGCAGDQNAVDVLASEFGSALAVRLHGVLDPAAKLGANFTHAVKNFCVLLAKPVSQGGFGVNDRGYVVLPANSFSSANRKTSLPAKFAGYELHIWARDLLALTSTKAFGVAAARCTFVRPSGNDLVASSEFTLPLSCIALLKVDRPKSANFEAATLAADHKLEGPNDDGFAKGAANYAKYASSVRAASVTAAQSEEMAAVLKALLDGNLNEAARAKFAAVIGAETALASKADNRGKPNNKNNHNNNKNTKKANNSANTEDRQNNNNNSNNKKTHAAEENTTTNKKQPQKNGSAPSVVFGDDDEEHQFSSCHANDCWLLVAAIGVFSTIKLLLERKLVQKEMLCHELQTFTDIKFAADHGANIISTYVARAFPESRDSPFSAETAFLHLAKNWNVAPKKPLEEILLCSSEPGAIADRICKFEFYQRESEGHWVALRPVAVERSTSEHCAAVRKKKKDAGNWVLTEKYDASLAEFMQSSAKPASSLFIAAKRSRNPQSQNSAPANTPAASKTQKAGAAPNTVPAAPLPPAVSLVIDEAAKKRNTTFVDPDAEKSDGLRDKVTQSNAAGTVPTQPSPVLTVGQNALFPSCHHAPVSFGGGSASVEGVPQDRVVVRQEGHVHEEQRVVAQHRPDHLEASAEGAEGSSRVHRQKSALARHLLCVDRNCVPPASSRQRAHAVAAAVVRSRIAQLRGRSEHARQVRGQCGLRAAHDRLSRVANCQGSVEQGGDAESASSPAGGDGGPRQRDSLAHLAPRRPSLHHVHVADGGPQGRRRSTPRQLRHVRPGDEPAQVLRPGRESRPRTFRQVPCRVLLPAAVARRNRQLLEGASRRSSEIPLPGGASQEQRGRRSDQSGGLDARLPRSPPRRRASAREGSDGHGGDADAAHRASERQHSAQVPGLEPHQRARGRAPARSDGAESGSRESVASASSRRDRTALPLTSTSAPASSTSASTSSINTPLVTHSAVIDESWLHAVPNTHRILSDSNADSTQRKQLVEFAGEYAGKIKYFDARLDLPALANLPAFVPGTRDRVEYAWRLLNDPSMYEPYLPPFDPRNIVVSRTNPKHTAELLKAGYFEIMPDDATPLATIRCFTTPDHTKRVDRFLQHPKEINELLPPPPATSFLSISDRCALVHLGSVACQCDISGYYAQFPMGEAVRNYYTTLLPLPEGGVVRARLCVGPTGQAHMVAAAVGCTEHLVNFERRSAGLATYIDNIIFVAESREHIVHDMRALEARSKIARVTFNEDIANPAALISEELDWCGIHFNFKTKEVSLTPKIVSKIDLSWSLRDGWTNRGFAGHLGLLFYAMQLIDCSVAKHFNLLRFASNLCREMQAADHKLWNEPAKVWPSALADLRAWTEIALLNEPRAVSPHADADILMLTDACATGFGLIAMDLRTGKTFARGEPWSSAVVAEYGDQLHESVLTETLAIFLAKQWLLPQLDLSGGRVLHIGTDSVTAKATFERGYSSRSHRLNKLAAQDYSAFPGVRCVFTHVPGVENVHADDLSRNLGNAKILASKESGNMISESLRRMLGVHPGGSSTSGVGESDRCAHTLSSHLESDVDSETKKILAKSSSCSKSKERKTPEKSAFVSDVTIAPSRLDADKKPCDKFLEI